MEQAPNFNFELDEGALLEQALEHGFVRRVIDKPDLYEINEEWNRIVGDLLDDNEQR